MNKLKQRIERLEERMGLDTNRGAQMIWFMPNLEGDDGSESDRAVRLCHGMWAMAWCGPSFSPEQIAAFKKEYGELTKEEMAVRFRIPVEWLDIYMGKNRKPNLITGD